VVNFLSVKIKRCKVCGHQAWRVKGGYIHDNPLCPLYVLEPEMMQVSEFNVKGEE